MLARQCRGCVSKGLVKMGYGGHFEGQVALTSFHWFWDLNGVI